MAARVQRGLRARIKEALGGALEGERVPTSFGRVGGGGARDSMHLIY